MYRRERDGVDRLELLRQAAQVRLARPPEWDRAAIRAAAPGVAEWLRAEKCWLCRGADHKLYWHHAIQVQHGGSNAVRNLIPICHGCHMTIHPWLEPSVRCEVRGWTKAVEVAIPALEQIFDAQ